ncbi:hypothetical protein A3N68_03340 [Enterobacter asburiae]|jgi:hypothetical protein|nr:hypothetical protein A3N68_03340 [Enterobacter asburiae]
MPDNPHEGIFTVPVHATFYVDLLQQGVRPRGLPQYDAKQLNKRLIVTTPRFTGDRGKKGPESRIAGSLNFSKPRRKTTVIIQGQSGPQVPAITENKFENLPIFPFFHRQ